MTKKKKGFLFTLPREIWKNRKLIGKLAKNDFRTRYAGSYLGIIWAFVQPVVTVFVYWLVFGVGLKAGSDTGVPFVLYLVCGIVPWFYFQEILVSGTNVLLEYSYLVKKVVFEIAVLPFVKAVSALFVHAFFVLIAVVIGILNGFFPSLHLIQIIYYYFAMLMLALGVCYATCAAVVFFRDLSQIIGIVLQIGIWSIPIMFDLNRFEGRWWSVIFKINPLYYIVTGYRDAIYGQRWFFERGWYSLYYWGITIFFLWFGSRTFRKLRVHFADVL